MTIEITSYSRVNDENSNVVGYVNFFIPEWQMFLNGCRYIRNKNGGFFVAFPAKEYKDKDGNVKYASYYCFKGDVNRKFQENAKKAIDDWAKKNA